MSTRRARLPRTLTLPSGARVTLSANHDALGVPSATQEPRPSSDAPAPPAEGTPLFADALALFDGDVRIEPGDVQGRSLADFHVIRAVLTKAGWLHEEEIEIDCHNCGEILKVRPCVGLETGPWEDDELDDPELDRTSPFGEPLPLGAEVPLGRVRRASTVTFAARTVREARPLFAALAKDPFVVDEAVIDAMGVVALGTTKSRRRIAEALSGCDDEAFESVTNAFLAAHYPLRLAADVFCTSCKARNTVDAPAFREFAASRARPTEEITDENANDGDGRSLPPLEGFVELAHAMAEPLIAELPGERVELVVEDGTPAVDDGGEPLLGSYLPPPPKDALAVIRAPTVTVYYKTFAAIEREEGRFDWEAELRETIEHELEHHVYFLRGDDPMDEEEHAEIDREALRIVGRAEATRRTLAVFGDSIPDFFARAWPLVLIGALVLAITLAEGWCAD